MVAPITVADIVSQTPYIHAEIDGVEVPGVLEVTIDVGMDIVVSSATLVLAENPGFGGDIYLREIVIWVGGGTNNARRFRGLVVTQGFTMWPHVYKLICRGQMVRAEKWQQPAGSPIVPEADPGVRLVELLAPPYTEERIVLAVLQSVPGLVVDPLNIQGSGTVLGGLAWNDLSWVLRQTALTYIQNIEKVSLGWRTFESLNGVIYRVQVFGYPHADSDFTFQEGVDIFEADGTRSWEERYDGIYVDGYNVGKPGVIGLLVPPIGATRVAMLSSALIERKMEADPGVGYSCETVAEWQLNELNRELVRVQFVTFRDELLGPGQTISVISPHTGLTEPVWLQHLQIRATSKLFLQTVQGLGGGEVGVYDKPPIE